MHVGRIKKELLLHGYDLPYHTNIGDMDLFWSDIYYVASWFTTLDIKAICRVADLKDVYLSGLNISDVTFLEEVEFLRDVKHLNLSRNNIRSLPKKLSFPFLETLGLSNNNIEDFNPLLDYHMPVLRVLDLNYNRHKLSTLEKEKFQKRFATTLIKAERDFFCGLF